MATDCNPGSSPLASLLLTLNMACTLFRLTPEEALAGATRVAAQALGLADRGTVAAGKRADLAIWDVAEPAELAYRIGFNPLARRIVGEGADDPDPRLRHPRRAARRPRRRARNAGPRHGAADRGQR